jgi:nucleotidyltransferase substrate binding protein (TIGR01987 family)
MEFFASRHRIETVSPREAMEAALKLGLIEDDGSWPAMLKDRNLTSHTYLQEIAEALYARLPDHLARFQALAAKFAPHADAVE